MHAWEGLLVYLHPLFFARGLLIALTMEAVNISETSFSFYELHGATTQKKVIFKSLSYHIL
jgi:hypothetical protein